MTAAAARTLAPRTKLSSRDATRRQTPALAHSLAKENTRGRGHTGDWHSQRVVSLVRTDFSSHGSQGFNKAKLMNKVT